MGEPVVEAGLEDLGDPAGSLAQAVDAERALLGVCLQAPAALERSRALVGVEDFWQPRHAAIFAAMCDLAEAGHVVDPVRLMGELTRTGQLARVGGAPYLHTLYAQPGSLPNLSHYAELVRGSAHRRRLAQIGARLTQIAEQVPDTEDALAAAARELIALELLIDVPDADAAIVGLATWPQLLAQPDVAEDWVIPGLVERQDVILLLAGEGLGKSWLARQLCLAVAAGVHPFRPSLRIPPQRTLLVDLENAPSMVRRQSRGPAAQIARLGNAEDDRGWAWLHPEGLNLRVRADAQALEQVIARTRPALCAIGPLGKAFLRGRDDWDTAAEEVRAVIDRLRARYRCAFWIEHHMPKGDGTTRPQLPFGSGVWQRWAGFGRVLSRVGDNAYELSASFRGDRDVREFPAGLYRGGDLPWSPIWDQDELDHLRKGGK